LGPRVKSAAAFERAAALDWAVSPGLPCVMQLKARRVQQEGRHSKRDLQCLF